MQFVFVHGWGYEAGFWAPLCAALDHPQGDVVDLGFHGAAQIEIPRDEPYIAVGHSFGVQWLLHHCADHPWQALVSINGFAKFTKADDFPAGTDARILRRMILGFEKHPDAVYRDFMALCGEDQPKMGVLDTASLRDGLNALNDWDERKALTQCGVPVLALAGDHDQVVSQDLSRTTFDAENLAMKTGGNHLLPQTDPAWCAARILAFVKDLKV